MIRFAVRVLSALALSAVSARAPSGLALRHVPLDLPGPPSVIVSTDLDGDGTRELAIVVAYSEVDSIGEDRIEDLVQISVVIPVLFERRELVAYSTGANGFRPIAAPLSLPPAVLSVESGPPGAPLVAVTDEGLSRVVLRRGEAGPELALEPILARRPVLAGSGTFQTALRVVHDVDGDGIGDILFPAEDGIAVYLWRDGAPRAVAGPPVRFDGEDSRSSVGASRRYPLPTLRDVDGDGTADLVVRDEGRWHVLKGRGDGTFVPIRAAARDCHDRGTDVRFAGGAADGKPWPDGFAELRDIDGDGRAEAVLTEEIETDGDGLRSALREVRRPRVRYSVHELDGALDVVREPVTSFVAEGHDFSGGGAGLPAEAAPFADLDGDGREELVTVTLDFSMLQAVRVLATKRISVGTDFHVFRQTEDGSFREVDGLDLSEKLKFDLDDLTLGRFAQFAGDFDGDGRQDFVHLGRGRTVTIHRGQAGARYPKDPDLSVDLDEPAGDLALVRIEDLDGDGRSDLRVTRPVESSDPDATAPVRLDLYLSGAPR